MTLEERLKIAATYGRSWAELAFSGDARRGRRFPTRLLESLERAFALSGLPGTGPSGKRTIDEAVTAELQAAAAQRWLELASRYDSLPSWDAEPAGPSRGALPH